MAVFQGPEPLAPIQPARGWSMGLVQEGSAEGFPNLVDGVHGESEVSLGPVPPGKRWPHPIRRVGPIQSGRLVVSRGETLPDQAPMTGCDSGRCINNRGAKRSIVVHRAVLRGRNPGQIAAGAASAGFLSLRTPVGEARSDVSVAQKHIWLPVYRRNLPQPACRCQIRALRDPESGCTCPLMGDSRPPRVEVDRTPGPARRRRRRRRLHWRSCSA